MGYVPVFCAACAGPVSHGFGLDGALEELQAVQAQGLDGNEVTEASEVAGAVSPVWALAMPEMVWLDALRVVTSDGISAVVEYDDFGVVDVDDDAVGLNPIVWEMQDEAPRPGVAFHADCVTVVEQRLAAQQPNHGIVELAAAYREHIGGLWAQQSTKRAEAKANADGQPWGSPDATLEGLPLNTLLPSIDYGEGVTDRCTQFYEFQPGAEWLVRSPLAEDDNAVRNKERVERVVDQLVARLLP
eukprot:m.23856 g.23856  ORF g.23856 m.23856 type:complete len:244 (-) comp11078_c0_seq1:232-963(-)